MAVKLHGMHDTDLFRPVYCYAIFEGTQYHQFVLEW